MNLLQSILAAVTGGHPTYILNGKPEGATGTNNGATPPTMVGSPNGLVPYSSTIGADKPYAGATRPAFTPHPPMAPAMMAPMMRDMLLRVVSPNGGNEIQGRTNPGAMPLQAPGVGGYAGNLQPAGNPQDNGYYQQ